MAIRKVNSAFDITSPLGEEFKAVEVFTEDGKFFELLTNRNGVWEPERKGSTVTIANVCMPHYHMNEWDVAEIKPNDPTFPVTIEV